MQIDPCADREALIIISGFRNERSLTTELASIGFEPPLQGHKGAFKCDVFIPHSDSPGDPTASGLCHLVVRRTPRAIDLLEGFMSGKSSFAPDIVPKNSSLIMVNRNVVYHEDNGAAGSTARGAEIPTGSPTAHLTRSLLRWSQHTPGHCAP